MKLKRRGLFARISATVVALLMVPFSTISVAYGLGDNDGVDETPVVATEPAESTEEPAQEVEEQSSETATAEKTEVVEEAPPAAEAPDATEEVASSEGDDSDVTSDAAADKAATEEKVEQAAKADDKKAEATAKKEEPKKTSAPEPKPSPSPSVDDEAANVSEDDEVAEEDDDDGLGPTSADLLVSCTAGVIVMQNVHPTGQSFTNIGYDTDEGEVILDRVVLGPGQTQTLDASTVPAGHPLYWWTDWLTEWGWWVENGGSTHCSGGPTPEPSPTPTEEPEPRPVDVGRDSKTGLVTATNPEGNPPVVVVVRDKDDKEIGRVSLKPGETGTVGTDRCEEVSIGIIVGDADEQFWGELPAEICTSTPPPSPTPTETVKPSPTPTPEPTAPEPTPSATPTPTPTPTQEPTKPVAPKPSPTTEPTATPSERPTAEPTSDKDGGSKDGDKDKGKKGTKPRLPKSGVSDDDPIVAIVGATVLAAAVSAGGLVAWRRRRAS